VAAEVQEELKPPPSTRKKAGALMTAPPFLLVPNQRIMKYV
jgi:hypothetical protein